MQAAELREGSALVGTALGEVAELARDVHRAVSDRMFGLLGPSVAPVWRLHDTISALAYGSARLGVRSLPAAAGAVAATVREPRAESMNETPRGQFVLSALNGFWGDRLADQRQALAPRLSLRTHDGPLRRVPGNVVHDIGCDGTGRLVIFVHGLCENDRFWWLGAEKQYGDRNVTYGSLLRDEQGWTPLYLAYNSGLHVSDNGRELSAYLESIVHAWPVPVTEIALVGHSMGGLITRSAAHQAAERKLSWVLALRHIVGLGTPHTGAPLERFVNAGTHTLGRLPETRPIATWLNRRSVGIKDLRYGAVLEDDWSGFDADERLTDRCTPATLLPGVSYSMVSATLSRRPEGLLKHDLFVQHSSAHGAGPMRRIEFQLDRLLHVGGKHHFQLLHDRQVYDQLRIWLEAADGLTPPTDPPTTDAVAVDDPPASSP